MRRPEGNGRVTRSDRQQEEASVGDMDGQLTSKGGTNQTGRGDGGEAAVKDEKKKRVGRRNIQ